VGRHDAQLGHAESLLLLPIFACLAANSNFIVFGLTGPELEPTIYNTRGEDANHYINDAVSVIELIQ